ncbi:hypothetical protein PFICI_02938 [Pestalotiopsis fici W106-1]|uniref:AB hydrolase-1 domain-containing protein n=1 Tax=Pestalotiopsis fici (strain W106-1 / CGMCC3.15140) TaxID=1229662 RepID=W3XFN2_PESFW|nr:uncharacterized protein PFICI_02938 [Pestalotiopsis fici W106-1]ETS84913.1 hypothetical protein PFICI_02938 [Pestalotiopsis fici W106-1]
MLGHSWGEMLAVEWIAASAYAANLRRLVISNSLASIDVCRVGITALRKDLPEDVQAVLDHADQTEEFETPEYESAIEVFCKRHLSLTKPWPSPEVQAALDWFAKDATTYGTMDEPSELYISGSLRNWTSLHLLDRVNVPTLLINGTADQAKDVAMQHFFDKIKKVKWITLDNAAHFSHVDQRAKYMQHLGDFLAA